MADPQGKCPRCDAAKQELINLAMTVQEAIDTPLITQNFKCYYCGLEKFSGAEFKRPENHSPLCQYRILAERVKTILETRAKETINV